MPYASQYPTLPVIFGSEKILVTFSAGQTTDAANNVTPNVIKTFINAVEKSGSTMTGFLTLNATPTLSLHAATKDYVDSTFFTAMPKSGGTFTGPVIFSDDVTLSGNLNTITPTEISYLDGLVSNVQNQINSFVSGTGAWKTPSARVAMLTNVTIASPGATLQGVTMAVNDRVLLNGQTLGAQNGVYVWNGAAVPMTRSTDCSTGGTGGTGVLGMIIAIMEGTYAQNAFMLSTDAPITIGVTVLNYVNTPFTTYTASAGVSLSGNNFSIDNTYFSGAFTLSGGVATLATVTYAFGGTGLTAVPSSGQLAIGTGSGYALSTITAGSTKISVTNGAGSITLDVVPANIDKNTLGGSALSPANGGTGLTALGSGVATWFGTPSSANLAAAVTDETGTGSLVFATSPTLITPNLGIATATSLNKITFTQPTTGATLTLADNSIFNTIGAFTTNFNFTAGTSVTFPTTGTLATLAGSEVLSNKTFVAPILGAATATSINGLTITSSTGTLTVANGATLATAGAFSATHTYTATTTVTFPTTGTLATLSGTETFTNKTITQTVNAQTGTTYTFVAADLRGRVTANNSSAQTYTCPQQSTLTTAAGVGIWLENIGTGSITIVKEGSETLTGNSLLAPGGTAYIFRDTTTNWSVFAGSAVIAEQITGVAVGAVVNQAYEISVYMPFPGTILGLALKTTTTTVAGTYTVAISGSNVTGLTTVVPSASGVRTYTSATAANTFVRGNYITITFAGSTITDAFWMLEYTRVY